jgi:hypothetical protein
VAGLALLGTLAATNPVVHRTTSAVSAAAYNTLNGGASPNFSPSTDTVPYTVKQGDTEWSIATSEGSQIADSGPAMAGAMADIDRQLDGQPLKAGDVVMLPQGSQNNQDQLASKN